MDRERRAQYVLEAAASDRGSPSRNSTAQVVIDITDVNDHEPMFNQTEYTASVSEQLQVRTAAGRGVLCRGERRGGRIWGGVRLVLSLLRFK